LNLSILTLSEVTFSSNRALGDPSVSIPSAPSVYNLVGGAAGGGVANFGTLRVADRTFTGNVARGAGGTSGLPIGFDPDFPGLAVGGGHYNFGEVSV
jgi:hypothetical protein